MTAVVKEKSLMRRTSARPATERKLSRRRKLSRLRSTRVHLTINSTYFMVRLMNTQVWSQETLSLSSKSNLTSDLSERVLTF